MELFSTSNSLGVVTIVQPAKTETRILELECEVDMTGPTPQPGGREALRPTAWQGRPGGTLWRTEGETVAVNMNENERGSARCVPADGVIVWAVALGKPAASPPAAHTKRGKS